MTSSAVLMASRRMVVWWWWWWCCNNNYQNRNLNAGSGGGPATPSNSDVYRREGERERAVNSGEKMIFPVRTAGQGRPDWPVLARQLRVSLLVQSVSQLADYISLLTARNQSQL